MNREIKFKAWCRDGDWEDEGDKMKFVMLNPEKLGLTFHELLKDQLKDIEDEFYLMQYTGLKDKNRNEIYEGDILTTGNDKPFILTWNTKYASWCLDRDGWMFNHFFGESCEPEDCEVIGNIFENPELIKEQK